MASGFFALLDDIAAIAKIAASSLDDVAAQALKAGKKTAGIVIDDAAVTPRYVVGYAAEREIPIIAHIAWGSIKNKLFYLLPAAMLLTAFASWAITPLLMIGGAYLCFEGYEKAHQLWQPSAHRDDLAAGSQAHGIAPVEPKAAETEAQKIAGAIRTDFVLSAEIMAITLAAIDVPGLWFRAATLATVAILVTVAVYGAVALIVKADDFGLFLAQRGRNSLTQRLGNAIVHAMPTALKTLSLIGMAAMLWVGGGILLHGLEGYGVTAPAHMIHAVAKAVGGLVGPLSGFVIWLIDATLAGAIGLGIGWLTAKAFALARGEAH